MNIVITTPMPEDARGIAAVLHKTWLATYPNEAFGITLDDIENRFSDIYSETKIRQREQFLKNPAAHWKQAVAKDGDVVVGTAAMVRNEGNNQLRVIYILPEYQGRGIGTMLWEAIKDFADPAKDTIVQVADYNKQAIAFYEKLGFVDTGKRWKDEKWKMKSGAYIPEMEMILRR